MKPLNPQHARTRPPQHNVRQASLMLGKVKVTVDWFVNPVAQSLWEAMPLSGTAERWGEEYYSDVGIKLDTNKGVTDMTIGDVAYWPPSKAICVFFGTYSSQYGPHTQSGKPGGPDRSSGRSL